MSIAEVRADWARMLAVAALANLFASAVTPAFAQAKPGEALSRTVANIEERTGARIGVSVTDVGTNVSWSHRAAERFPIASTFKAFLCAHLLDRAAAGKADVQARIRFERGELETYSPVTKDRTGGDGMSLFELCDAATSMSDNTATNLVMRATGGPKVVTQFMRSIGDTTTRIDRYEPDLNDVGTGEVRDTTSPEAAAASLRKLLLGDALGESSRDQLKAWLIANQVGGPLLRASLPKGWLVADRTGSGGYGSRGVIAIVWPTKGSTSAVGPLSIAIYLTRTTLTLEERNAIVAEIGEAIVADFNP